jgi:hypothetical protein
MISAKSNLNLWLSVGLFAASFASVSMYSFSVISVSILFPSGFGDTQGSRFWRVVLVLGFVLSTKPKNALLVPPGLLEGGVAVRCDIGF